MTTEDDALDRLLAAGARIDAPSTPYGTGPDHVHETYGPVAARTLVVVHGGYFRPGVDRTHARPMARALADLGWRVVLAEYRRVPGDPDATLEDLQRLDGHLRRTGHDVAAWVGHSAGGALVMWRALHPDLPPVRVLALAPVADFDAAVTDRLGGDAVRDWVGATPDRAPDVYARLDPSRLRSADPDAAGRVAVLHGDEDASVPLRQSEGWARTVLTGAHHFDVVDPASPHWPAVVAALPG
ncbi:alpha/beta hydrolase, partial [Janibacter hoylei]|uniref:alpha/beta hydrolase n=1 Tax=Janibacter hoylei TaxID=364298 RepID=UPI0027BAB359